MIPNKSLLFYSLQYATVGFLLFVAMYLLLESQPVIKVLALTVIPIIYGILTPFRKSAREIDELSIQRIDKKTVFQHTFAGMPIAIVLSIFAAFLFLTSVSSGMENKLMVAAVIVVTGCLYPLCYYTAEAATLKYAETLK